MSIVSNFVQDIGPGQISVKDFLELVLFNIVHQVFIYEQAKLPNEEQIDINSIINNKLVAWHANCVQQCSS